MTPEARIAALEAALRAEGHGHGVERCPARQLGKAECPACELLDPAPAS